MLVMQLTTPPRPLRTFAPELPSYVEQAVMRALAKDREVRFGSMDYFVGALLGTYPAQTAQGSSGSDVESPQIYSTLSYGSPPPPRELGAKGSRVGLTPPPEPAPQANTTTITTFSHAKGETTSASSSADLDLESIHPRRWPYLVGLGVVATAAAVFFVARPGPRPTVAPEPPAQVARPAEQPPEVRVQIRSVPAGAAVTDAEAGTVLGMTPFDKSYARGGGAVRFGLRLAGFKDRTIAVGLDQSSTTSVDLEAAPAPAEAEAKPEPVVAAPVEARKAAAVRKVSQPARSKPAHDEDEEWRVH
jgi:hypothetical protein